MSIDKLPAIPLWQLHGKREKLACVTDYARWKLGLLDKYLNVDYRCVERVIFVCKGNICRSAYAEAKFIELGGGAISAGTHAASGHSADKDAVRIAKDRGIDLSSHRTTNLTALIPQTGDLYVCMEVVHADQVAVCIKSDKQVLLLGGMLGLPRISDPYNKSDRFFSIVFDQIDLALSQLRGVISKK